MKKLSFLIYTLLIILVVGCKAKELTPQQQAKVDEYTRKIESPDFVFIPSNVQPMGGRSINLDPSYYLKVTKDTVEAYLPYFGRAYTAPTNPTDIGIKFVSTDFDYNSEIKKNGTYEIRIEPLNLAKRELQGIVLYLNISNSGYGSLSIQSTNRQNISYYGTID